MTARPAAKPAHVCATRRARRSQDSDSAGGFPTRAACRAGLGRFPRCMSCTTGRPASPLRRLVAVRPVGFSEPLVYRSAGSGNGLVRWDDHAEPCSLPDRAAASQSSASSRRAAQGRGGRCRRLSERAAREACLRSGPPSLTNHRPALTASGAASGRAAVTSIVGGRSRQPTGHFSCVAVPATPTAAHTGEHAPRPCASPLQGQCCGAQSSTGPSCGHRFVTAQHFHFHFRAGRA